MRLLAVLLLVSAIRPAAAQTTPMPQWVEKYREPAGRLIAEATATDFAWQRLAVLTDRFGHRLSGSEGLEQAIRWAVAEMKRDGLENVHTEPVMVPKWVRGRESATMVEPGPHAIVMLGLGDSIGTSPEGVQAEVLVVSSFADLEARAALAKGRIVLFNVPFVSYGDTRTYRMAGPSRAARHGAIAALVRAVGPLGLRTPHTGALQYALDAPRIPAASVTGEDAERMQRLVDRGERVIVRLQREARFEGEVESANVVGELTGRERPDEVVVVAGHLDSWDVGTGASDDGGGCVATWEALRIMKKLGLRPRRTVRVVLFTNEENGGRGGLAYRDRHRAELPKHVMMLESDIGVFRPTGFGLTGSDQARHTVTGIATLLRGMRADLVGPVGGGADIDPSAREAGIPALSLEVDGDYFMVHHTPADTIERIVPAELAQCAAAVAVMAYVVADLPQRLGE